MGNLSKTLTILVAILILIGLALGINVTINTDDPAALDSAVSLMVGYSKYLLIATIAIAVILSLLSLVKNPDSLKKTLLGLAVLAVILVGAYILGDSQAVLDAQGAVIEGGEEGASSNQWIGTLIWYSSILLLIGGVFFVFDLIKGIVKN